MKSILIINKHSRRMRTNQNALIKAAKTAQKSHDLTIKLVSSKDIKKTVRKTLLNDDPQRLIIAGGDGTVTTAAHLLANSNVEFAIIPCGTTNSFARTLNIPLNLKKALELALTAPSEYINLGQVNSHHYVSVSAIGLSERVASTIPDSLKKRLGRLAYYLWGALKLLKSTPIEATIKYEDLKTKKRKTLKLMTHQIVIANAELHGSLPIAKGADVKKNELILLSFGVSGSKLHHLKNLYLYLRGRHHKAEDVVIIKSKSFDLKTKEPRKIEVDGEVITKTPAKFLVKQDAIKIALPKSKL